MVLQTQCNISPKSSRAQEKLAEKPLQIEPIATCTIKKA